MINIILFQPEIGPNTGNIIRTCFATNAKLHIIKPLAFDLFHPSIKRAAAGHTLDEIDYEIYENYSKFLEKHNDKKIYYITRYGLKIYSDVEFDKEEDTYVMFGRESTGIPKEILSKNLSTCLRIPMTEKSRSINLANCANLIAYEILRQKKFEGLSVFEVQKGKN